MRLLFVDGSAGAAGDMILGALVHLGAPLPRVKRGLRSLSLPGWSLRSRRVERHGLVGRKIDVRVAGRQPARGWAEIRRVLRSGSLEPPVLERSLAIFRRLLEAEAEVHGVAFERVHLHEAGAADAIVDVVGSCLALHYLGVERVVVSPLTTGYGTVRCKHGRYPVPAPATLLLVRDRPVRAGEIEAERLTPTGAAILTTLADAWGPMPLMRPSATGYGAGDHEFDEQPNFLRAVLGSAESTEVDGTTEVLVLETTLDDVAPQTLAHACERLLEHGALDVDTTTVTTKKGRSGQRITVLARPDQLDALSRCLFEQTSTLGLRLRLERRIELPRTSCTVRTPWGEVPVKVGTLGGREIRAWPEYEVCAALARRHGLPLAAVQAAALEAYRRPAARERPRAVKRTRRKRTQR